MGVPPLAAVATPLPATVPSALLASIAYFPAQEVRLRAAGWTLTGGVPGTIVGAFASKLIGGTLLLVLSGLVLVLIGQRILRPIGEAMRVGVRNDDTTVRFS